MVAVKSTAANFTPLRYTSINPGVYPAVLKVVWPAVAVRSVTVLYAGVVMLLAGRPR